jgi:hypothetical protein
MQGADADDDDTVAKITSCQLVSMPSMEPFPTYKIGSDTFHVVEEGQEFGIKISVLPRKCIGITCGLTVNGVKIGKACTIFESNFGNRPREVLFRESGGRKLFFSKPAVVNGTAQKEVYPDEINISIRDLLSASKFSQQEFKELANKTLSSSASTMRELAVEIPENVKFFQMAGVIPSLKQRLPDAEVKLPGFKSRDGMYIFRRTFLYGTRQNLELRAAEEEPESKRAKLDK